MLAMSVPPFVFLPVIRVPRTAPLPAWPAA